METIAQENKAGNQTRELDPIIVARIDHASDYAALIAHPTAEQARELYFGTPAERDRYDVATGVIITVSRTLGYRAVAQHLQMVADWLESEAHAADLADDSALFDANFERIRGDNPARCWKTDTIRGPWGAHHGDRIGVTARADGNALVYTISDGEPDDAGIAEDLERRFGCKWQRLSPWKVGQFSSDSVWGRVAAHDPRVTCRPGANCLGALTSGLPLPERCDVCGYYEGCGVCECLNWCAPGEKQCKRCRALVPSRLFEDPDVVAF